MLTPNGFAVDEDKIQTIVSRKEPRNIKELLSFNQTWSCYRRFIRNYAETARPLTDLTETYRSGFGVKQRLKNLFNLASHFKTSDGWSSIFDSSRR